MHRGFLVQVLGFKDTYIWVKDDNGGQKKRGGVWLTKTLNSSDKVTWLKLSKSKLPISNSRSNKILEIYRRRNLIRHWKNEKSLKFHSIEEKKINSNNNLKKM